MRDARTVIIAKLSFKHAICIAKTGVGLLGRPALVGIVGDARLFLGWPHSGLTDLP